MQHTLARGPVGYGQNLNPPRNSQDPRVQPPPERVPKFAVPPGYREALDAMVQTQQPQMTQPGYPQTQPYPQQTQYQQPQQQPQQYQQQPQQYQQPQQQPPQPQQYQQQPPQQYQQQPPQQYQQQQPQQYQQQQQQYQQQQQQYQQQQQQYQQQQPPQPQQLQSYPPQQVQSQTPHDPVTPTQVVQLQPPATGNTTVLPSTGLAVGIDLGTTFSCVAVYRNGHAEVIPNETGTRTTPSCVSFVSSPDGVVETFVGEAAKAEASQNPRNTIFEVKRLIGRRFEDPIVQSDRVHWPFQVVEHSGCPVLRITPNESDVSKTIDYAPEEISAMVLAKLKSDAESYLGQVVHDAVITVPAYFNDAQRSATKDAAILAGLRPMRIINEPTAASIAYGLDRADPSKELHILVFDLGGGTFDVSVLHLHNGIFSVKATGGNTHLGGEDFDNRIVDHILHQSVTANNDNDNNSDTPASPDDCAMRRLRTECERAKRTLSQTTTTTILVDAFWADKRELRVDMTRETLEAMNEDLFQSCLDTVRGVLRDAKLDRSDIDDVVFVGGSTRIPRIQEIVQAYFNGKEPCKSIHPDEAVAHGASIQAAILAGHAGETADKVLLCDVAPLSVGCETAGGMMNVMIPRNTRIPAIKTDIFSTLRDNQDTVHVAIFEGERAMTADNHLLGRFELGGIPAAKRGVPQIEVTFEIDVDGILHVSAFDKTTGNQQFISIQQGVSGRLSKERVEALVAEADRYRDQDQQRIERISARNELDTFVRKLIDTINGAPPEHRPPDGVRAMLSRVLQEMGDIDAKGEAPTLEWTNEQRQRIDHAISSTSLGKLYHTTGEVGTVGTGTVGAYQSTQGAPQVQQPQQTQQTPYPTTQRVIVPQTTPLFAGQSPPQRVIVPQTRPMFAPPQQQQVIARQRFGVTPVVRQPYATQRVVVPRHQPQSQTPQPPQTIINLPHVNSTPTPAPLHQAVISAPPPPPCMIDPSMLLFGGIPVVTLMQVTTSSKRKPRKAPTRKPQTKPAIGVIRGQKTSTAGRLQTTIESCDPPPRVEILDD